MGTSLVLTPGGDVREVTLPDSGRLHFMHREMGCSRVDVVCLTSRLDMWIDDFGIYTQPVNVAATALAQRYGKVYQPYHGSVLLCSMDEHGNSTNLTVEQVRGLLVTMLDAIP
ncbi:DUF3846 domain-containing protein [Nonomuraea glycinis]|uniref:DUF3846 domain-containing protein n=1 Tax=Nonomuraea glycinis TaxID=2047744 RepID=UPI0033AAC2BA